MGKPERFFETPTGEVLRNNYIGLVLHELMNNQTPSSPDYFLRSNAKIAAALSPKGLWQTRRDLRAILGVTAGRPQTPEQANAYVRILMEEPYDEEKALEFHQKIQEIANQRKSQ